MKIGCVLVLYNPNWDLTSRVIESIISQIDLIFISDNSPYPQKSFIPLNDKIIYHSMNGNKGIATAQNEGIKYFININYDFMFFLDQDSIVEPETVIKLLTQYQHLIERNICVGAIGPRPINRQEGKEYRGSIKKGTKLTEEITEVTEIINSASLISVKNFISTGGMDDSLFIDGVDHEWCWRCNKVIKGRFFIAENVHLSHQLGEGDRYFLWKKVAIPTPFRTYYQYRNYFILSSRKYVPLYWKISNGIKYIIKAFYYPIFISPRKEYLKNISKGIRDGIESFWK